MDNFSFSRRHALGLAATGAALAGAPAFAFATSEGELRPMTGDIVPISGGERLARLDQAQRLMRAFGIDAMIAEPGASLVYFTGIKWHRSERLTAAIIPANGDTIVVTPFFEAPSVRETLAIPASIRTWEEDENPIRLVAGALRDRKATGTIAIEDTLRFFAVDGLREVMPDARIVNAAPVVRRCRMVKSPAEIALMQKATDITIAAYRHTHPRIERGMTPAQIGAMMDSATEKLGGTPEFALILLGEASAYPHGSGKPQQVRDGEVVLMDCGCTVEGYQSDVSRTFVYGAASASQRKVWDQVRRGQEIAFRSARIGAPAGSVDDAVRRQYEAWGYGPRYGLPGLSHRTGHGIGLDGHEPAYLVHGDSTPLAVGMCFSNEPGIYIPGSFGIRIEDCFHMTGQDPVWFSQPPTSIDRPFG